MKIDCLPVHYVPANPLKDKIIMDDIRTNSFKVMNSAYNRVFKPDRLSLGLVVPLEAHHHNPVANMDRHIERIQLAEALGFSLVWLRDVPFNVPTFGDAGQLYDPFVYLGYLAAQTNKIALGVASIVLPLRHPAQVAKAAASADVLSGGRLLLGIASGDRPEEYPAMNMTFEDRGERFRQSVDYIRQMASSQPHFANACGEVSGGIDMLPKPSSGQLPLLITGGSQQHPDWIAQNGDGWMTYPRNVDAQAHIIDKYRAGIKSFDLPNKPVMQSLYIDLADNPDTKPHSIHLGFRSGSKYLIEYLSSLEKIGVNHVALNLRFNNNDVEQTMKQLALDILPNFSHEE